MRFFFKIFTLLFLGTVLHVHAINQSEHTIAEHMKTFQSYTKSNASLLAKHKKRKTGQRGKRGKRGGRGPQGLPGVSKAEQSSTPAYGGFYFDPVLSEGVPQITPTGSPIPFTGNTQVLGLDIANALSGEIKVLISGDYLIQYEIKNLDFISGVVFGGTPFYRVGIKLNGVVQNPTVGFVAPLYVLQSEYGYIAGRAILSLTEGDSITLENLGKKRDPNLMFIAPPVFSGTPVYVGPYAILTILKVN